MLFVKTKLPSFTVWDEGCAVRDACPPDEAHPASRIEQIKINKMTLNGILRTLRHIMITYYLSALCQRLLRCANAFCAVPTPSALCQRLLRCANAFCAVPTPSALCQRLQSL
jgi:hypothetical protein